MYHPHSLSYLTYSFDIVSTINNYDFISEFEQKDEESDVHYCNRKINKLAELYSGKDLLIIDNFNAYVIITLNRRNVDKTGFLGKFYPLTGK